MRRVATVILVLIVVLGVGGTVVDRYLVARTEDRLLAQAREQADLAEGSDVEIDGFPFLTQVAAGRLAEVRGTSPSLVVDGFELRDVRIAVRGVAPEEPFPAETIEINAEVPVATLRSVLGQQLDVLDPPHLEVVDGLLQFSVQVAGLEVAGVEVPSIGLSVQVDPVVDDGAIVLRLEGAAVGGASLPDAVVDRLDDLLTDVRLEIPGLPEGLEPTRLAVGEDGLQVRLEGADVELGEWAG